MTGATGAVYPLNHVLILDIDDRTEVRTEELTGVEKFTALRNEIYRWEYLKGMQESETTYVARLLALTQTTRVTKVSRPANILIDHLRLKIEKFFVEEELNQETTA